MQPINQSFNKLIKKGDFKTRYEAIKREVKSHPDVRAFLNEHRDELTDDMLNRSLIKLYEYINQSKECNQCLNLDQCKNILPGYHPNLVLQGKTIDVQYERCPRKVLQDERNQHQSLIQSMYIPKEILNASMETIDLSEPSRLKAINLAQDFVEQYERGKRLKGLYLHGPFGTGKTYILGAIANELADKKLSSMFIYVPEFLRELKGSLYDHSVNDKIEAVKTVRVLMLDDFGAESMSSWVRDDILGAILQFRMLENLPTFFTSNFDFSQLEHHLSYTQRGEEEKVKAARIMERIKYLATPIEIRGKNWRDR